MSHQWVMRSATVSHCELCDTYREYISGDEAHYVYRQGGRRIHDEPVCIGAIVHQGPSPKDFSDFSSLIQLAMRSDPEGMESRIRGWLDRLPDDFVSFDHRDRPINQVIAMLPDAAYCSLGRQMWEAFQLEELRRQREFKSILVVKKDGELDKEFYAHDMGTALATVIEKRCR